MYTRTFKKTTSIGTTKILISGHGFRTYIDGQFIKDGMVDDSEKAINALLEADFEEVDTQ